MLRYFSLRFSNNTEKWLIKINFADKIAVQSIANFVFIFWGFLGELQNISEEVFTSFLFLFNKYKCKLLVSR